MKPDAVVIIGGGLLQHPMVHEAHALGLEVIVTDGNPQAPAFADADKSYVMDTYDAAGAAALVEDMRKTYTLRGVCSTGADIAPTISAVAAAAGLPGIPVEVAERTHNKWQVREALRAAGLDAYQPRWECNTSYAVQTYIPGFPCVVKPLSQRASRGVSLVHERSHLQDAIDKVHAYGPTYLIEQCLAGTEHSAEMILGEDGEVLFFNIVDRFFDYREGIPLELGHVNPTRLGAADQGKIRAVLQAAARALGVTWGPFKADLMMVEVSPWDSCALPLCPYILEVTARLSGGFDSAWTCPATARHPMRLLLQLTCGLPVEPQKSIVEADGYAARAAILPQTRGRVKTVPRLETPEGVEVIWTIQPGDVIHPARHNGERAGFCNVWASFYDEAWASAKQLATALATRIQVEVP
jgi:biotin carboxylase